MKKHRDSVIKVLAGVALGVIVGAIVEGAVAQAAWRQFQNAAQIGGMPEFFTIGYVAGVHDALTAVVDMDDDPSIMPMVNKTYRKQALQCLARRGTTLISLIIWAKRMWAGVPYPYAEDNAASLIVANACAHLE
jgi:hypothetical protein